MDSATPFSRAAADAPAVDDPATWRNLRRVDWRFLLPPPPSGAWEHLVLLGGSDQLRRTLLDLGVAREVSRGLPPAPVADALIGLLGAREPIREAAGCLRPEGALFWEIDRRAPRHWASTPRRVVHALRRAGLTPTGTFWAKPNLVRCGMYLPLEVDGAVAWYFATLFRTQSVRMRLLRSAVRLATGWKGERLGRLVPCFAVTARKGSGGGSALPAPLHQLPGGEWAADLPPLMTMGGEGEWSRVIMLPFAPGTGQPAAVVKFPRTPRFNPETEHERERLLELRAELDSRLRTTLPQPLAAYTWNGLSVSVESCVAGRSLSFSYDGTRSSWKRATADLVDAAAWLEAFHQQTLRGYAVLGGDPSRRIGRELIARYRAVFGSGGAEAPLLAAAERGDDRLRGSVVPLVAQHTDFGPWNVYRTGAAVRVLDWEVVRDGPALCDLLYFVLHWYWQVRRRPEAARRADLPALFVDPRPADQLVRAARATLLGYMDRMRIERALLPLMLVYTLAEQALDRHARRARLGIRPEPSGADNPYVDHLRGLAEHTARLFATGEGRGRQQPWWER